MSKPTTWMPLYIGDYLGNTQHLTAQEHGAYLLLLMHYWKTGGPIKRDKRSLKNITKISEKKLTNVLTFFEEKDGFLYHWQVEEEIKRATHIHEKNQLRTHNARAARSVKPPLGAFTRPSVTMSVTGIQSQSQSQTINTTIAPELDLNRFEHAVPTLCHMLGLRQMSKADQETVASWCERYDMRGFVLPIIEKKLNAYRARNQGSAPYALSYFSSALEEENTQ